MRKGDRVIWRVTSGLCTLEWKGVVTAVGRGRSSGSVYVLFDGGGHWRNEDELILEGMNEPIRSQG